MFCTIDASDYTKMKDQSQLTTQESGPQKYETKQEFTFTFSTQSVVTAAMRDLVTLVLSASR